MPSESPCEKETARGSPPTGSESDGRREPDSPLSPRDVGKILGLAGAVFLLHLALERLPLQGGVVGLAGAVVGLFAPAPAIHVFLRWGTRAGLAALLGAAVLAGLVGGAESALQFLASIGVIAWLLSLAILSRRSAEVAVGWSILGAGVGLGVLYLVEFAGLSGGVLTPLLHPESSGGVPQMSGVSGGMGQEEMARLLRIIARLMPVVAVVQATLMALLNYALVRYLWVLRGGGDLFPPQDLGRWSMPEPAVWVLIAGGVSLLFLDRSAPFWVVANVLLAVGFGYFLQGLAILHFLFRKFRLVVPLRVPLYFMAATFSYAVAAFGLFDLWFDFRKIRSVPPPSEGPAGNGRDGGRGGEPS